jgi:PAS domain S-box-containing protein/diguanylate cyclase (GGDEF)-like protein
MSQIPDTDTGIPSGLDACGLLDHLSGMAYRCRWDGDWVMEYVSRGCTSLTGYTPDDVRENRHVSWSQLIHSDDLIGVMKTFRSAVETRKPFRLQYRLVLPDGRSRAVVEEGCIATEEGEFPRYIEGYIVDDPNAEVVKTEAEDTHVEAAYVLDKSRDAFLALDSDGTVVAWNRQSESTFGWSRNEAVGRYVGDLLVPPDQRHRFREHFKGMTECPAQEVISGSANLHAVRRTGESFPVELNVWPTSSESGIILNAFVHDLTERRAMEHQLAESEASLRRLSREDPLTGLASRRTFDDELTRAISFSKRWGQPLSLLIIGPDDRPSGDSFSHKEWDELMVALARQLRSTCRVEDLPARLDRETFAVVLPNTTLENARTVEVRLRRNLGENPLSEKNPVNVSVGLSTLLTSDDPDGMVHRGANELADSRLEHTDRDVGDVADARTVTDVGDVADARAVTDVGQVADARTVTDAGQVADARTVTDAGQVADARTVTDIEQVADAGQIEEGSEADISGD